jgi:hypothetical protein
VRYVVAFLRFWYEFVVGDDWRVAVSIVAAIGLTAALVSWGVNAWWVMPIAVVLALYASLRRTTATARR